MRVIVRLATAAATAGLLVALASASSAQTPDKPATPVKPTAPVKPTTADKPPEGSKPAAPDGGGMAAPADAGGKTPPADAGGKAAGAGGADKAPPPPATGGKAPPPPGLKVGEYACTGGAVSGFKVTAPGAYAGVDGGSAGAFTVTGNAIAFQGGALNGQPGHDLKDNAFGVGAALHCALKVPPSP